MNTIHIRLADETDILELQKVGKQTFLAAFGRDNAKSDMDKYLNDKFNLKQLESELMNPESEFYFAETKHKIIGYLKVNVGAAQTENTISDALEIERIYVISGYQGKSIGKMLLDKAIELAKQKKLKVVWLGVWEKNTGAIRFYQKNGLIEFDRHMFKLGQDEQTDVMMKLELSY
jgi:diamine N-acetyltransferase